MKRYGVRPSVHPSVCLSHLPTAAACGGFAAVGPAERRYRSTAVDCDFGDFLLLLPGELL